MLGPMQFGAVLPCHILVAPTGFENSWNICAENSDAPDVEMLKDLVLQLQSYSNVNSNKIRVLGVSNGAGLANRFWIENTNPGIDIVCATVSHLNDFQYHTGNFYKPGGITNTNGSFCGYDVVSSPLTTTKYLSISNVNDPIIPYLGGTSVVGANFLPAETAAHHVATYKGYTGSILTVGGDYRVFDPFGRTRLSGKINSENTSVDITNLSKGVHYLVIGGDLNQVLKVVKD